MRDRETHRQALLQRLLERQGSVPDFRFSLQLGLTASYWSHIRHGRRRLTDPLIRRIRVLFPELEGFCMAALLEDHRVA